MFPIDNFDWKRFVGQRHAFSINTYGVYVNCSSCLNFLPLGWTFFKFENLWRFDKNHSKSSTGKLKENLDRMLCYSLSKYEIIGEWEVPKGRKGCSFLSLRNFNLMQILRNVDSRWCEQLGVMSIQINKYLWLCLDIPDSESPQSKL